MLAGVLVTFGSGSFLIALEALEEAKHDLRKINELAKWDQNRLRTLNCFGDLVQFHGRLIQLSSLCYRNSEIFNELFPTLFVHFSIFQICE